MLDLAYNLSGEPFEVPGSAVGWRVRKLKAKASPEVVYGRNGTPLVLRVDADMADLRREARDEGRYRLDAIDDRCQVIPGCPSGYVCIHPGEPVSEPFQVAGTAQAIAAADLAVIEAMRINSELAKAVIEKFPMMLESAAVLLSAADSAGMPRRPAPAYGVRNRQHDDEDADDPAVEGKPAVPQGFIEALVDIVASVIVSAMLSGEIRSPDAPGTPTGGHAIPSEHARAIAT
jgi:hypothetical protein